ncbi:hypothetical protein [Staphylococcus gallinarum]|uniref:hypothetical protein n=1 Tax=Staphylococcus gallinarum TaxID=1293 RepID=UPI002DB9EFA7|nr:hypothetical protein [Staphylococcus gallinarum]MEB6237626.1 hypothetical protein [Staphylococcus gallinarum]MEB7037693.1 hypothetical protein [Staphylococcus gallinarum]
MGLLFISILHIVIARLTRGWIEPWSRHASYSHRYFVNKTQFLNVITPINKTLYNELIETAIISEIQQEMNNELSDEYLNKIANYPFYLSLED